MGHAAYLFALGLTDVVGGGATGRRVARLSTATTQSKSQSRSKPACTCSRSALSALLTEERATSITGTINFGALPYSCGTRLGVMPKCRLEKNSGGSRSKSARTDETEQPFSTAIRASRMQRGPHCCRWRTCRRIRKEWLPARAGSHIDVVAEFAFLLFPVLPTGLKFQQFRPPQV